MSSLTFGLSPRTCYRRGGLCGLLGLALVLWFCQFSAAQVEPAQALTLAARIEAIHQTPNWQFVTPEFIQRIHLRQAELQGPPITLVGTLRDKQGKPIRDAFVLLRLQSNSSLIPKIRGQSQDVFAVTWSDEKGIFRFKNQPTPWVEAASPLAWQLNVFAPGKAIKCVDYQYFDARPRIEKLQLDEQQTIWGKAVDVDGQPLSGVPLAQYEIIESYEAAAIETSFLHSECLSPVTTDADGAFHFGGLPANRIVSVLPTGMWRQNVAGAKVATSALEASKLYPKTRPRAGLIHPFEVRTFEIASELTGEELVALIHKPQSAPRPLGTPPQTRMLEVRVVDAATGKGVPQIGIGVRLDQPQAAQPKVDWLSCQPGMPATDAEGRFQMKVPRQRMLYVYAMGRKFGYLTHYRRLSTSTEEYTPPIATDRWLKSAPAGDEDVQVVIEVTAVSPFKIQVQREDGSPAQAGVTVWRHGWSKDYVAFAEDTDGSGQLELPLRPVIFSIDIEAETADGLIGRATGVELSKDWDRDESLVIVVREP